MEYNKDNIMDYVIPDDYVPDDDTMELICGLYDFMEPEEKAEWSLQGVVDLVRDQRLIEVEQGLEPRIYDPKNVYEVIRQFIEEDAKDEDEAPPSTPITVDYARSSYEILLLGEQLGAHTVEIREYRYLYDNPMEGVAASTPHHTVQCFVGADSGDDDCELTVEEFNRRFMITAIIFG